MRLFIAQEVDPAPFLDSLKLIKEKVNTRAKWVDPEKLHLTYQFLGDVPDKEVDSLKEALSELGGSGPVKIALRGLGAFPSSKSARVLWIGVDSDRAGDLARSIRNLTKPLGFVPNHSFSPHVTVARIRGRADLRPLLEAFSEKEFTRFTAGKFFLKESILMPAGPDYRTVYEVQL